MKVVLPLLALLLAPVLADAAQWAPRAQRVPGGGWSDVGVPGGIPDRLAPENIIDVTQSYGADNTGATDAAPAIQAAVNAATTDQVIFLPAGTYRLDTPVNVSAGRPPFTIRGAGWSTIIDARGQNAFAVSTGTDWTDYVFNAWDTVSGSKGDTQLTVISQSSASFAAGKSLRMAYTNDDTLLATSANENSRIFWSGYIAEKSGDVITIIPPLPYDTSNTEIMAAQLGTLRLFGIEEMHIDGANGTLDKAIYFQGNNDSCWVKGVKITNHDRFGIYWDTGTRIEIRKCYVGSSGPGPSHGGMAIQTVSMGLIEDNIIIGNGPNIEMNFGCTGTVVAYNYFDEYGAGGSINMNHGAYNRGNLYEGNITPQVQSDGYHAGSRNDVLFRNWLTAINGGSPTSILVFNRMTRDGTIAGNVMQSPGFTWTHNRLSLGNPNLGNPYSTGSSSFFNSLATLTTRSSDSVGVITGPVGHTVATGDTIDVMWAGLLDIYTVAFIRKNVTAGTVSGTTIPISGGAGDVLPASGATIYIPTSNDALRDYPLDWDAITHAPRIWTGELTTRTSDTAGVITLSSGMAATMAAHLAESDGNSVLLVYGPGFVCTVSSLVGDALTFTTNDSSAVLPGLSAAITLSPSHGGFQELDMDVIGTLDRRYNYNFYDAAIPASEALGTGDTLPDSLYRTEKPEWFGTLAWPPISPESPPTSYDVANLARIPAGWRYVYGNEDYLGEGAPSGTATATTANVGTLNLAP